MWSGIVRSPIIVKIIVINDRRSACTCDGVRGEPGDYIIEDDTILGEHGDAVGSPGDGVIDECAPNGAVIGGNRIGLALHK